MAKCKYGRLKSPVRERGSIRRCKLKKKTPVGRERDRTKTSREFHELRYNNGLKKFNG